MTIQEKIVRRLSEIEKSNGIRILFACESGSRAWGFPSSDSDYDVRFLYLHPITWYLSIRNKRDVIEYPLEEQLDLNGWDLPKALDLLSKSNSALLEWIGSPIIYRELLSLTTSLRNLASLYFSRQACMYHYVSMAQKNFNMYLQGEQVSTKKYFYVLRPLLAAQWIERGKGIAPTEFQVLVKELVHDPVLKGEIQKLLEAKASGAELDYGPRIVAIADYIEKWLPILEKSKPQVQNRETSVEPLDNFFISILRQIWPDSFNSLGSS